MELFTIKLQLIPPPLLAEARTIRLETIISAELVRRPNPPSPSKAVEFHIESLLQIQKNSEKFAFEQKQKTFQRVKKAETIRSRIQDQIYET